MKMTTRKLVAASLVAAAAHAMAGYQIIPLGNADPGLFYATYPQGSINANGQVAAFALYFGNFSESTSYRWSGSSWDALTAIPSGAFTAYGYGFDINDSGMVAGSDFTGAAAGRRWTSLGVYDTLQPLATRTNTEAFGINNLGDVVGFCKTTNSDITPTIWTGGSSSATDLGVPAGFTTAKAFDIANGGAIAGEATVGGLRSAIRYQNSAWSVLSPVSGFNESIVHRISDTGFVAGAGFTSGSVKSATYWDNAGQAVNLGYLGSDTNSEAWGINNFGWVVGESNLPSAQSQRTFLYRPGQGMVDLNTLIPSGFTCFIGYGINEKGDIVGLGLDASNQYSAFIAKRTDVDIVPTTYQWLRGTPDPGNALPQLYYPDNNRLIARKGFVSNQTEAQVQLVTTAMSPSLNPSSLSVQLKAQVNSPNLRETIELFNVNTNTYETVGTPSLATVNTDRITITNATGSLSRFIQQSGASAGQIKAKVSYRSTGFVTVTIWAAKVDQFIFTVEP